MKPYHYTGAVIYTPFKFNTDRYHAKDTLCNPIKYNGQLLKRYAQGDSTRS